MNEEAGDLPDQRVMDCKAAVVSAESKDDERIPTVWPLLRLEAVHIHSPTNSQEPSSLSAMALCCHRYFDPEQGRPRCQHLLHRVTGSVAKGNVIEAKSVHPYGR